MTLFSSLLGAFAEDRDDVTALPELLRDVYLNPWKALGVQRNAAKAGDARDAFRILCLHHCAELTGLPWPKRSFDMVVLAYRLITGELQGPAQDLAPLLRMSPLFKGAQPTDILHTLRPLTSAGIRTSANARACKMLAVSCVDSEVRVATEGAAAVVVYTCAVSYCMRRSVVRRSYAAFAALHTALSRELILLPAFPEESRLLNMGIGDTQARGHALCRYVQRVHDLLSQRGVFSPRVMAFLEIDFARVHIEEEGRVVGEVLDSANVLPGTVWQVVSEEWMAQWRKFVQSRGARRYLPPGPITNGELLMRQDVVKEVRKKQEDIQKGGDKFDKVTIKQWAPRPGLVLGEHYRVVNFNVWRYWVMVYGGGPSIGRKKKDIYTPACASNTDAVIKIQAVMRAFLARRRYWQVFMYRLATEAAGAKEVLYDRESQRCKAEVEEQIEAARKQRSRVRLRAAAQYTQRRWREKKGYMYQDDRLKVVRHIQEVFERADDNALRESRPAGAGANTVVTQAVPVVTIEGKEEYTVEFTKETGLAIGLRKVGRTARESRVLSLRVGSERRDAPEQTAVFEVPPQEADRVCIGSILLEVNGYPVSALTHRQTMAQVQQATWPLRLKFRRPLEENEVMSLAQIYDMRGGGHVPEELVVEQFKRKLLRGQVLTHCSGGGGGVLFRPRCHLSRLSIDESNLYYEGEERDQDDDSSNDQPMSPAADNRHVIPLYNLRHVERGKATPALKRASPLKGVDPLLCFAIFYAGGGSGGGSASSKEKKSLNFAVPIPDPDDGRSVQRCELLVWGFRQIIAEMQSRQVFMDKDGVVRQRTQAKKVLQTLPLGAGACG